MDIERIREPYKVLGLEPALISPVPHFIKEPGILDLVFELDEGLMGLIRLDESFIPSPGLVLTGDTVLAYVADKKITVADVANRLLERLEKDTTVTPEQRQKTLLDIVVQHLPGYLHDELVLHEFRRTIPPDKVAEILKNLEPAFSEILEKMATHRRAQDADELKRTLLTEEFSMESLRESYVRRQIVVGYSQSMPVGSPIQNQAAIEAYCRQLLFEFADDEMSMEKFHPLPGPPSFAVFGIVKNTGWQKLEKEIRLLDAIEMAGGVEDPKHVTIAITNPDILEGKAIPVSMSLKVLQNDKSGKLNRVVKDGDMINVTRNDSTEAAQAGSTDGVKLQGNGVNSDSGLVGTFKNDDQREVPAVAAPTEIAENKPASKENWPEARCVVCSYPVADLLIYRHPRIMGVDGSVAADAQTRMQAFLTGSLQADQQFFANRGQKLIEMKPLYLNGKPDFAPLIELIRATVQPESWDPLAPANISVDDKTQSLVIRQTNAAHNEIADLLTQIRSEDDQAILIRSSIVKLTDELPQTLIESYCSLHSLANGTQWALLSKQRSEVLTRELFARKPDVLSRPQLVTNCGRKVSILIGQSNAVDDTTTGIRLEIVPHLLPKKTVIRLQHAIYIGLEATTAVLLPAESLVGSGQTLVLLVDLPSKLNAPSAATSKYLLLITPEYVPIVEEEEAVPAPSADAQAEAIPETNQ